VLAARLPRLRLRGALGFGVRLAGFLRGVGHVGAPAYR
jgi:hypothetical protein